MEEIGNKRKKELNQPNAEELLLIGAWDCLLVRNKEFSREMQERMSPFCKEHPESG